MTDAWSEIMRDSVRGIQGESYIERDDGLIDTHSVSEYIRPLAEWTESERLGIQHAKGIVLDIGCGAGRVALYLQSQGHEVVGIDSAPGAIEACKNRGLNDVRLMSATKLDFPAKTFDTVIMYGNNFGILGEESNIIGMLEGIHRITTRDGIIIAGSVDVTKTDNEVHKAYHRRNLERDRPQGLIRLRVKYKDLLDSWGELRLASPDEISSIARKAGWTLSKVYKQGGSFVGILTKR